MRWIYCTQLLLAMCCCGCDAKFCHQKEVADVYSSIQYELEMIEIEKTKCLQSSNISLSSNGSFCSQVFDGIMCWPAAKAGTISVQRCPIYMTNVLSKGYASKLCLSSGEWFVHPYFNTTWTNLSGCYDPNLIFESPVPEIIQDNVNKIKTLYDIGYGISLVSLVIAVIIMLYFRRLRCQRNTVHINMFVSFILRSVICFMKDIYLVPEVDNRYSSSTTNESATFGQFDHSNLLLRNSLFQSTGCKVVYSLFYYILSSNCMWIFVEGIYMHSFVQSTKYNVSVRLYRFLLVFGWGFPFLFVIPWILVRIHHENTVCWNINDVEHNYIWIIKGPITATVVINFFFFINIIRVLYTKLSAVNKKTPKRYRKLAKSTLVLIPLFGVYHVAFIAVPSCMDPVLEVVWMYAEMFLNSFQGFAVSLLFCYMNEEVKREFKKIHRRRSLRRNSHISNKSVSKSVGHSDPDLRVPESPNGYTKINRTERMCNESHRNGHKNGTLHNEHNDEMLLSEPNHDEQQGQMNGVNSNHNYKDKYSNGCVRFHHES